MSTLAEIEQAIEQLPPEQWMEIRRWMDQRAVAAGKGGGEMPSAAAMPDFLVRQKERFGDRVLGDSQPVLDEIRAERF
ncbi:MAG: hypothetical protein ABIP20_07365 [Chthoniobacteraceae bacterium]